MKYKGSIQLVVCIFVSMVLMEVKAQVTTEPTNEPPTYIIFADDAGREALEVDSVFFVRSLPIIFPVGKSAISADNPGLQNFIKSALPLLNDERFKNSSIRIRSAASPEGPLWLNRQLSKERRDALLRIFSDCGVKVGALQIDVVDEEYELLAFFMRQAGDKDAETVTRLVNKHRGNPALLKQLLQKQDRGALWKRLLKEYFPQLRASRFVILLPETKEEEFITLNPLQTSPKERDTLTTTIEIPEQDMLNTGSQTQVLSIPSLGGGEEGFEPRRELLSVKTNALLYGVYIPFGYKGFCPIPNVAIEYYPLHGHFTYGLMFDCPWWQGNTSNHKYFQARNYTVETRYYFRSGDVDLRGKGNGAAFKGTYLSAYANAAIYGIGWSDKKGSNIPGTINGHGWQGEGAGAGLGIGYVTPLSKNERWRLELSAHLGFFCTKYDPYVYGCPVENVKDGLYYYDFNGDADQFKKREYMLTWVGPTRVGLTISYDLLYRHNKKHKASFKSREKGGEQ